MSVDDRNLILRWASTLSALSTLAWAGARHSVRGGQLHKDGCVGRLQVQGEAFEAVIIDGEMAERATLTLQDGEISSGCTCGVRRCSHAVALLMEAQRRARSTHESARTQQAVMGALRQRLQVRAETRQDERQVLSNLDRLPLDAAVDLVCLAWRQSLRPGAPEQQDLERLTERLTQEAVADPTTARGRVLRVVAALTVRKVVFVPLPTAVEPTVARLVAILDLSTLGPADPGIAGLLEAALDGPPQLAPAIATALARQAGRNPALSPALATLLLAWKKTVGDQAWRETSQPGGRDLLWDQVGGQLLAAGDLEGALQLARAWGPGRSHLIDLAQALSQAGRAGDVQHLLGWYDPRGDLWRAGGQAAIEAARQAGDAATAEKLATWAFERQPIRVWYDAARQATSPRGWAKLRMAMIERAISDDDAEWLADAIAGEPGQAPAEVAQTLRQLVQIGPLRDRTATAALRQLDELAPLVAVQARQIRIAALAVQSSPSVRGLRAELGALAAIAAACGEPELASQFAQLLGREYADVPAVAQAVSSR